MLKAPPGNTGLLDRESTFFVFAVLGFSFWFFMAVPFASHRETYWWLATVHAYDFGHAFSFISSTYRPLHQAITWLAFLVLDPGVFPTSVVLQTVLQALVYALFVLAWWFIYSAAPQPRLFSLIALVSGAVFFSGYVHLFHVYGTSYVPVMLILGMLLRFRAVGSFDRHEAWLGVAATLLVFWHPFATALFVAFYFGYYIDTFPQRRLRQHVEAHAILLAGSIAVAALVFGVPHAVDNPPALLLQTATRPLDTRLFALLVSYQTNEVNPLASVVALILTQLIVASLTLSWRSWLAAALVVCGLSALFFMNGLPLVLIWVCTALLKLLLLRCWSLFFLALAASLLPLGGGIGTPIHALFAIIIAAYVTPLGWVRGEQALSFLQFRHVALSAVAALGALLLIRAGVDVPVLSKLARPLLAERERTYQLEHLLDWLRRSDYCERDIAFVENSGSPIDSVASALERRHRPPAPLDDVQLFWRAALKCRGDEHPSAAAIVTFGAQAVPRGRQLVQVEGRFAGSAAIWVRDAYAF